MSVKMCTIFDEKTKLWGNLSLENGSKVLDILTSKSILQLLLTNGPKVAQINDDNGLQMTFHEIWLQTVRAAQNLQKRHFHSRQVFCFMANNNDQLAPMILASICLFCPILPLHPALSKDEIVCILKKAKPSVLFCDGNVYSQVNEALRELTFNMKVFIFGEHIDELEPVANLLIPTGEENNFIPIDYDMENDIAAIFCSSGTTGPSKSKICSALLPCGFPSSQCIFVVRICGLYTKLKKREKVSIYNLLNVFKRHKRDCPDLNFFIDEIGACISGSNFLECASYEAKDSVILSFDNIYWSIGVKPILDSIYNCCTRIITMKSFTAELQLRLIEKYKVNILFNPPFNLVACLKNPLMHKIDLSNVKTIFFYGSKVPSDLIVEVKLFFPTANLFSFYGLTETGFISLVLLDATRDANSGQLLNGRVVKIVDSQGKRCGPNESGEICVNTKPKFLGYLNDVQTTANAVDSEDFLLTGDIGHFNENGIFYFEDRKKNIIRVYYFRAIILPLEIEEYLITLPDVKDVCIVGIPVACGSALPAAVIVRSTNSIISRREVFNAVAEHFPNRSKLRGGVYFVESLATTHSGKLLRRNITDLATEMFDAAKGSDDEIQSFFSDIPDEFRKLIMSK